MILTVQNLSTVFNDGQAQALVNAWKKDLPIFCDVWGVSLPQLQFVGRGGKPTKGTWLLALLDTSDQAGALGYHDVTPDFLPLGKAFLKTDADNGYSMTVTADHELKEMLVDPLCDRTVIAGSTKKNMAAYAYEVCDPCEDDKFGYTIDNVLLSDWIYPAWFDQGFLGPFDFKNHIKQPFQLLPGGYASVLPLKKPGTWTQITAKQYPDQDFTPPRGSRRARRQRYHAENRTRWISTYTQS